jgi:hypothetical protein
VVIHKSWQEDGGSRLFKELGIPGVLLVAVAGIFFFLAISQSLKLIPVWHPAQSLQICLVSVVAANLASFLISHQQYSGDPMTCLFVVFLVGAALGAPRLPYVGGGGRPPLQAGTTPPSPATLTAVRT